jgi:hypothetical protein
MKTLTKALLFGLITFAAGSALAVDDMKKGDAMAKDGMAKDSMTMQQCKDHMAMSGKEGMKKDDAMMKKDTICADMMKKDGMAKNGDGAMQPSGMASGTMKK